VVAADSFSSPTVRRRGSDRNAAIEVKGAEPLICDRVLLAVGRVPNTRDLGLEEAGVELGPRGRVEVDEHFATTAEGVYAVGDLIRDPMLAHKAEEEGVACVERLVTGYGHVDYDAIPGVCYTEPEIASVGKTEEELAAADVPYRKWPSTAARCTSSPQTSALKSGCRGQKLEKP
jgi:dihydrolipoamide dehydrogenase